jgi:hypothetical protein
MPVGRRHTAKSCRPECLKPPRVSYSGSFVLMIMFGLGIVNSVWVHRHEVER